MIPDEAVEAALAARLTFKNQRSMDNAAHLMRHILEAAAPHLMAEAWDEGHSAGDGDASAMFDAREAGHTVKYIDVMTRNPYRAHD